MYVFYAADVVYPRYAEITDVPGKGPILLLYIML
jgi:hypothetical protein